MTRPILFAVDLDPGYRTALPHAAAWAEALGSQIRLFHALDVHYLRKYGEPFAPLSHGAVEAKAREAATAFLGRIARTGLLARRRVQVEVVTAAGAAPAILTAAAEASLVVMASPIHTTLGRLLLGSVTARVLAAARTPVVVCPYAPDGPPPEAEAPARYERLLFATDLSPAAAALARALAPCARAFGSRVECVHVIDRSLAASYATVGWEAPSDLEPELEERVRARLAAEAPRLFPGLPTGVHVLRGRPIRELTRFARDQGVGLIAMATHGQDSLEDRFLGSTTERVVRLASCPVYALPIP